MTSEAGLDQAGPSAAQFLVPLAALVVDVWVVAFGGGGAQTIWYVIRASGVIAYALLAVSVCVGLLISNRVLPSGRPRVDVYEAHTFLSLLVLGFTSIHGVGLLLDSYIGFSPVQVLIPFTSTYRPLAVAAGIASGYVALLVYGSFWARRYIGYKTWRTLHYASFLALLLGAAHGIWSGSDSGAPWMTVIYAVTLVAVGVLIARRVYAARSRAPRARPST